MMEEQRVFIPQDATPEAVALSLLQLIALAEGKRFDQAMGRGEVVDRKWILKTYLECIDTVRGMDVHTK